MNKSKSYTIVEILSWIFSRPKMYFEKPTINNLFRFIDGYYMSETIHSLNSVNPIERDIVFWENFCNFLSNKYDKKIVDKDIGSRYMAEHLLNEISIEEGIDFDLFVDNFKEFQINEEYDANKRLNHPEKVG